MNVSDIIATQQKHALNFERRMQSVCAILQDHRQNTDILIHESVAFFHERNEFDPEYLIAPTGFHHSAFGHVASCATTGTPADEGRAFVGEIVFGGGKSYIELEIPNEERYAYEFDPSDLQTSDTRTEYQRIFNGISFRIQDGQDYLEEEIRKLKRMFNPNGVSFYSAKDNLKKERMERQLTDNKVPGEECEALYDRIRRQRRFFLNLTGNKPVDSFSMNSIKLLPTVFLGVTQIDETDNEKETFQPIPVNTMNAIESDIRHWEENTPEA